MAEVVGPVGGNAVEHLGFENVDARVDEVGHEVAPAGLFIKPADAAVLVHAHHAVLRRIRLAAQHQRGQRAALSMERRGFGQVQVGQAVAGEHGEGLIQHLARLTHAAGGAQRRGLHKPAQAHAQRRAVAKVIQNRVGLIAQRGGDLRHAVGGQQLDGILHDGPVHQPHHRLRAIAGQRSQARALAARHDDRLHENSTSSIEKMARRVPARKNTALQYLCAIFPEMASFHTSREI